MNKSEVHTLLNEAITAAKAIQKEPGSSEPGSRIRRIGASQSRRRERARQLLMQVIELDETNISAWLWLSAVLEDPAEKRICLENVLTLDPSNKPAALGLAHLDRQAAASKPAPPRQTDSFQTGRPRPASAPDHYTPCPTCGQPISSVTTTCRHCHMPLLVDCPACDNRLDIESASCPQCGQALGDFRQGADYFAHLAAAYRRKRPQKALAAWKTVKKLQADYPHIDLQLGQLQAEVGRTDAAIKHLRQAMAQQEDTLAASLALGAIFQELRRWDEAKTLYRKALEIGPKQAEPHFAMGWLLMEQGRFDQALSYLQKTTKLDPKHDYAWLRMAQLQDHLGNRKQAARAYRQARKLLSTSSIATLQAQQRLTVLQPDLPQKLSGSAGELLRQMTGPCLIVLLAALLDAGLRPWWIPLINWLALFLAVSGSFLWVSGSSLPRNPLLSQLLSERELSSPAIQLGLALAGAFCWLLGLSLILLPLGQSFPEVPAL